MAKTKRCICVRSPHFRVGDRVMLISSQGHPEHMEEGMEFEIAEVRVGPYYAVKMNGELHRWFAQWEIERHVGGK